MRSLSKLIHRINAHEILPVASEILQVMPSPRYVLDPMVDHVSFADGIAQYPISTEMD